MSETSTKIDERVELQGQNALSTDAIRKYCDCCEEEWEQDFFCTKCSGVQHFDGEMVLEPNLFWDGSPNDEYTWQDRESEYMDVCRNCCRCNVC